MSMGEVQFLSGRAKRIERALISKNWTRVQLADATGYDERTIRNVLGGRPVRNQTIIDICQALGIEPELSDRNEHFEVAEELYGAYARGPFRTYEGGFFAYRRSFSAKPRLMRTVFELAWCDDPAGLIFHEHSRFLKQQKVIDHSQSGHVYISPLTDLIHLLTTQQGAVRLITLTKMRGGEEIMRGIVLTQSEHRLFYQPSVSAMVLVKIPDYDGALHRPMVGPIDASADEYEALCGELDQTESEIVQLARGAP